MKNEIAENKILFFPPKNLITRVFTLIQKWHKNKLAVLFRNFWERPIGAEELLKNKQFIPRLILNF